MTLGPAAFAAVFVALYVGHQLGDHWVQTGWQAANKHRRDRVGVTACARHVATLTATKVACLALVWVATGLGPLTLVGAVQLVAGFGIDAVSHYWADRRFTLAALAGIAEKLGANGKVGFSRMGAPRDGHDDNPTLGTGAYALDQSFHYGAMFLAAVIIAAAW